MSNLPDEPSVHQPLTKDKDFYAVNSKNTNIKLGGDMCFWSSDIESAVALTLQEQYDSYSKTIKELSPFFDAHTLSLVKVKLNELQREHKEIIKKNFSGAYCDATAKRCDSVQSPSVDAKEGKIVK